MSKIIPYIPNTAFLVGLLCAPFVWSYFVPTLESNPYIVPVTTIHPEDSIRVPKGARLRALNPTQEIKRYIYEVHYLKFGLDIPSGGDYALYGISSNTKSDPATLSVNGVIVSNMAFYEYTGSRHKNFETHRILSHIRLHRGENKFILSGNDLFERSFILVLYRHSPMTLTRYTVIFSLFGLSGLLCMWLQRATAASPKGKLVVVIVATVIVAVAPLTAVGIWQHTNLKYFGYRLYDYPNRLEDFESYLESDTHKDYRKGRFSVCIFGDSTHQHLLKDPEDYMMPTLRRELPDSKREKIEIYGLSNGAASAYHYYYLTNRIVAEKPDLLIIEVNMHTFSYGWQSKTFHVRPNIHRFLRLDEMKKSQDIYYGDTRVSLGTYLLQKADDELFNYIFHPVIGGLKYSAFTRLQLYRNRINENIGSRYSLEQPPSHRVARPMWKPVNSRDNPMFKSYKAINRLTEKHGIPVLYYATPINESQVNRKNKIDIQMKESYDFIRDVIVDGPHIHFLDLSNADPELFSDGLEHLTPEGIEYVAGRLAEYIVEFKDEQDARK
jgi:hypothetical protein